MGVDELEKAEWWRIKINDTVVYPWDLNSAIIGARNLLVEEEKGENK